VTESPHIGHHKTPLQRQQLGTVQARRLIEHSFAVLKQMDFDPPPILRGAATLDKTLLFATGDQCDNAVMLRLQALREFSDRRPFAAWIASDIQQQQVLQRRDAVLAGDLLAEPHEFPDLVAKIRKDFKIILTQATIVGFGHAVSVGRKNSWRAT
jgi:hypothetical protein